MGNLDIILEEIAQSVRDLDITGKVTPLRDQIGQIIGKLYELDDFVTNEHKS